jgi:hypothetical protein
MLSLRIRREDTFEAAAGFMEASVGAVRRMLSAKVMLQLLITATRRTLFHAH